MVNPPPPSSKSRSPGPLPLRARVECSPSWAPSYMKCFCFVPCAGSCGARRQLRQVLGTFVPAAGFLFLFFSFSWIPFHGTGKIGGEGQTLQDLNLRSSSITSLLYVPPVSVSSLLFFPLFWSHTACERHAAVVSDDNFSVWPRLWFAHCLKFFLLLHLLFFLSLSALVTPPCPLSSSWTPVIFLCDHPI